MPEISLTDFVDFVVRSGPAKVTKVREIRERGPYAPALDFWKPLREGIVSFHAAGTTDKRELDRILRGITDPKKLKRYPAAISAYKKFLGRKQIAWFRPPTDIWEYAGLEVRVNPELGLAINGQPTVTKLYFKGESRRLDHLQLATEAMRLALTSRAPSGATMAVLDVGRSRLATVGDAGRGVAALLRGEAASFVEIWNALGEERTTL